MPEENVEVGSTPDASAEAEAEATDAQTPESAEDEGASQEQEEASEAGEESDEDAQARAAVDSYIKKKYGGNYQQFVDGLWNAQNSSAKLHEENRALRDELAEIREHLTRPKPDPAEQQRILQQDPDVQACIRSYNLADKQLKTQQQRQQTLVNDAGDIEGKIRELRGEARRAEDYDRSQIEGQIALLEREKKNIQINYQDTEARMEELQERIEQARNEYNRAVAAVESNRAQKAQVEKESRLEAKLVNSEFDMTLAEALKPLGIALDSKEGRYADKVIRARLRQELDAFGDGPGVEIAVATKALADEYIEMQGLAKRKQFAANSKAKLQTLTGRPAPAPAPAGEPPPARRGREQSAQEILDKWDRRARGTP